MTATSARSHPTFPGGLKLNRHKEGPTAQPIAKLSKPAKVTIPLLQHRGLPATCCVDVGQSVTVGELIGLANGALSANVHATVSGTVTGIVSHNIAHRSGLSSLCIEITTGDLQHDDVQFRIEHDYHLEDPNVLRSKVADAGIVGLGGAAFPSALKLAAEADQQLHTLIINGAECAPYITCDEMLMRERAAQTLTGVQILLHILQINACIIALEDDRSIAIEAMRTALEKLNDERLQLHLVPVKFPEGGERQLIQVLSGKEVPSAGLPVDIGYLCHNVGTAYALFNTFIKGAALTSRIVTVCGAGVSQPQNIEAPFGASIKSLVDACGGYTPGNHRIIVGGPMMGFVVADDSIPIDKSCNCLLIMPEEEARQLDNVMPCIRCGECAEVCPASLLPQQLYWNSQSRHLTNLEKYNLFDCIECGCCDYVCPSNLPLTQFFRYAKDELWFDKAQQRHSQVSRQRFENREQRLIRKQQERDLARAARRQPDNSATTKQQEIAASVARAKARRQSLVEDQSSSDQHPNSPASLSSASEPSTDQSLSATVKDSGQNGSAKQDEEPQPPNSTASMPTRNDSD